MIPLPIRKLFIFVFQQVDDLTDHKEWYPVPCAHPPFQIQQVYGNSAAASCSNAGLYSSSSILPGSYLQVKQRQYLVFGHTHGFRGLDQQVGLAVYRLRISSTSSNHESMRSRGLRQKCWKLRFGLKCAKLRCPARSIFKISRWCGRSLRIVRRRISSVEAYK